MTRFENRDSMGSRSMGTFVVKLGALLFESNED